ncbi:hypothetical protein E3N88_14181 [Mikania micrantha]|uniref:Uncharacterized protein n=1 Tax=Mikania micrantha TaxID=192012 RepID=A0A5N6P2E8_9ASTR|nr:hypothetical protein E3N88_14181 [Mikania micrantha]
MIKATENERKDNAIAKLRKSEEHVDEWLKMDETYTAGSCSWIMAVDGEKIFHSHCPQTARMYYHPPAEKTASGGASGGRGGADGGAELFSTFDFISAF